MSNQHVLKIHPAPLADLLSGAKTAEVRRNDRGFQVGDTVRLMEVNPETGNWTGAADHVRTISHIQTGYGLPDGICVLSYADTARREALARVEAERDAMEAMVSMLEEKEWAEHASKSPVSSRLETCITTLMNELSEANERADEATVSGMAYAEQRDTAQAQLAEAVGLLKELRPTIPKDVLSLWCMDRDAFLARHAQAEQRESQGAQAGDETNIQAYQRGSNDRAALATQSAAGEPVYQYMRPCGEWDECERSFYEYQKRLGKEVRIFRTAPPAAAHVAAGEPAVNTEVIRREIGDILREVSSGARKVSDAYYDRQQLALEVEAAQADLDSAIRSATESLVRIMVQDPPAAAHGDELVAVVGTVPDGSGFKSLDFKVELESLPDGTRLYAAAHGDEAVLWELLEELRTATDRQALPGEFIRVMWEAGCDWINARTAMRAQGEGDEA